MVDLNYASDLVERYPSFRKWLSQKLSEQFGVSQLALDLATIKRVLANTSAAKVGLVDIVRGVVTSGPRLEAVLLAISRELPSSPGSHWRRPEANISRFEQDDQRPRKVLAAAVTSAIRREVRFSLRLLNRKTLG